MTPTQIFIENTKIYLEPNAILIDLIEPTTIPLKSITSIYIQESTDLFDGFLDIKYERDNKELREIFYFSNIENNESLASIVQKLVSDKIPKAA